MRRLHLRYKSKIRVYRYKSVYTKVHPEVFPPYLTFSTKILLDYLSTLNLKDKQFLELGCGSGIISLFASKKGALVTASDINTVAIKNLEEMVLSQGLKIDVITSDLFKTIQTQNFDLVIINPPYYAKTPKNMAEKAWFCGENFEYFEELFSQLQTRQDQMVLMILSDNCNIKAIKAIASKNSLIFTPMVSKTMMFEKNYIFEIARA